MIVLQQCGLCATAAKMNICSILTTHALISRAKTVTFQLDP